MQAARRLRASSAVVLSSLDEVGHRLSARKGVVREVDDIHKQLEQPADFEYQKNFKDVLGLGQELSNLAAFFRIYDFKVARRPDEFTDGQWTAVVKTSPTALSVQFHSEE